MLPHREEEVEEEEGVLDTLDASLHPDLSNLIMPLTSQHYSHTGATQPPAQPPSPHRWWREDRYCAWTIGGTPVITEHHGIGTRLVITDFITNRV